MGPGESAVKFVKHAQRILAEVFVAPDPGRALITGDPNDLLNFKIATLWGIKDTAPYFHDNSARTLEDPPPLPAALRID
jgi:cytochrome c peroxidase